METEYTALSYVWGDPKVTSPIAVNSFPSRRLTTFALLLDVYDLNPTYPRHFG